MSSPPLSEDWRSSGSRLLGWYSLWFVLWCALLMGSMYWRVNSYLQTLADQSLRQRAHLLEQFSGEALPQALADNQRYDVHGIDAYGLFAADGTPLRGQLRSIPQWLPQDGEVHSRRNAFPELPQRPAGSCSALAMHTSDGQLLVLVRKNGSLMAVSGIILDALFWGVSLTIVPGLLGWHLLRRRPLRRVRAIQDDVERIAGGELTRRLPLSSRRDELDMLASIVNAMLDRIERLMREVKNSSDAIAHDLRTPLTRLRAHLYRMRQQTADGSVQALPLDQALEETDSLLVRFRALLRISELEDHQRRSSFVTLPVAGLLQELHALHMPLAEEQQQNLQLQLAAQLPPLHGDRALLFEALANLLGNALKFTPRGGQVVLAASVVDGVTRISVDDSGPGIAEGEREAVLQRFYRSTLDDTHEGHGLGLSIVAAIAALHGYELSIARSPLGGAQLSLLCRSGRPLL